MTATRRATRAKFRRRQAGSSSRYSFGIVLTSRRGKTLIEMLILISVLGIILGTTATTLVALFKTDRQVRRDLAQLTTLARLSSRFRTDAHAAVSCQVDQSCSLKLPDGRVIHYALEGQRLQRRVERGTAVEHRDAFVLPDTAVVKFEQPAQYDSNLLRLTIRALDDSDKAFLTPIRPATIEAAIGVASRKEDQP